MDIKLEMGSRIRELRKRKGMTQEQLAEKLEISPKHMSCIERGLSGMSIEHLSNIAKVLDVSLDYLVNGSVAELYQNIPQVVVDVFNSLDEEKRIMLTNIIITIPKI